MPQLLAAIIIALAWLVPNHYPPWVSFYNEAMMAIGLLILALDPVGWRAKRGLCACAWVVFVVILVPWGQWFAGLLHFSGDLWVITLYLLGLAVAVQVGYERGHANSVEFAALVSSATLVAGVVSALLGINQVFQAASLAIWSMDGAAGMRAGANLAQPNNLATLLGFAVLSLFVLREQRKLSTLPSLFLLLVLLIGASLTQSRAALLFGPLIVVAAWILKRRSVPIKTNWLTLMAATACHWLFTSMWPALERAMHSTAPLTLGERGVASVRFQIWPALIDALSQSPWLGYGWLQVGAAEMNAAESHAPLDELWLQGHNLFLELVIWCGYPLGLALCGLVIYWVVSRLLWISTVEAALGWMTVGVLGVHAMVELPHHYAYFLLPAGLWIGLIEASIGSRAWMADSWSKALSMVTFVLLLAVVKDYPAVEDDFRLVRFEFLRIGKIHPAEPAPDAPFLSSLTAFLAYSREVPTSGLTAQQLSEMEAITLRYPYPGSILRYASALALNGRIEEARLMFVKLRSIYGQQMYDSVRTDLRERIAIGEPNLLAFEKSLPP